MRTLAPVKQSNSYWIKLVVTLVFLWCVAQHMLAKSQFKDSVNRMDFIEISLLTVGPGNEIWSLYGHTAIRYQDHQNGADIAINYGAFSFDQNWFIPRFIFGLTDYEMIMVPMDIFLEEYAGEQRWVLQQNLNLTKDEKLRISSALYCNALPENRVYRYNYFYDNCTTRARDMILNHLNQTKKSTNNKEFVSSYREMIHQWNENHRWARFGNDLLLGLRADIPTSDKARQFLPDSLRKEFEEYIIDNIETDIIDNGIVLQNENKRKLVDTCFYLIQPQTVVKKTIVPLTYTDLFTPERVFGALLVMVFILTVACQWRLRYNLWLLDLILLFFSGIGGVVLLAMIFSQHPTVQVNLQILLLNPLSLLFLYPTLKAERKKIVYWYWKMLFTCIFLFFMGGIWQNYAEGMYFMAFCLLIRCITNIRFLIDEK